MKTNVIDVSVLNAKREEREKKDSSTLSFVEAGDILSRDIGTLLRQVQKGKDVSLGKVVTPMKFKTFIEARIGELLIDRNFIDSSYFLCGMYISRLMTETIQKMPESWCAVDFRKKAMDTQNSFVVKDGGDMCFLISAVFPERGNWRLMSPEYYEKMGIGFYYEFYTQARAEIGYHMSKHFQEMAEVTQACLVSL